MAAAPIPISSPTAIALAVYLSVVPASLILLLIIKYFYMKNRKADVAGGHTPSRNPSSQLRTQDCLGNCTAGSDWCTTRTAFLVGLLGSPDWEIKVKESEPSTINDTNSQFSYASLLHSKPDPSSYISLGSTLANIVRALISPTSTTDSAYSVGWVELLGLRGYSSHLSRILCLRTNPSSMLWTPPPLPLKVL